MSDIESDYQDYQSMQQAEGGEHPGRSTPSRNLLWAGVVIFGILLLGLAILALISAE